MKIQRTLLRPTRTILLLAIAGSLCSASGCDGSSSAAETQSAKVSESVAKATKGYPVSGSMRISGTMPKSASLEGKYVMLYETEGKDRFVIDSTKIEEGKYVFDLKDIETGLYRIGTSPSERALGSIILNPTESPLEIVHRSPNFVSGLGFVGSKENEGYGSYIARASNFDKQQSAIRKGGGSRADKLSALNKVALELKAEQDALADRYSGTFLADMVSHLQSDDRGNANAYWNDLDFTNTNLIHSPVYADRIEDYMRSHGSKGNSSEDKYKGFYNAVDRIAALAKDSGNDRVLEFVLYTMSEGFYKSGIAEVSHYVIDNYFYGDACGDSEISELFKMKAAGIRKLQVGNTPPSFSLPSSEGEMVHSAEVVNRNELTLIMFWASTCHKCETEVPLIASSYREYHPKGFEVIGVSVDQSEAAWKNGIVSKQAPGVNLSDLLGWSGPVTKEYRVTSTPVFFLVDNSGTLVARPKSADQLETYLSDHFGK